MPSKTAAVVAVCLLGWMSCGGEQLEEQVLAIAEANNAFSTYLYQAVRSNSGNIIMSPLSVANLLAMLWLGAGEYSAHELIKALRLTDSRPTVEAGFRALLSSLKQPATETAIVLDIANKVFIQEGFHVHTSFQHAIRTNFLSDIQHVDFMHDRETARTIINRWVEESTHNKIKDLIPKDTLDPDTKLILTNAIYFKGEWLKPFVESENVLEPFFLKRGSYKDVPMMYQASKFLVHTFRDLNGLKMLKLPYSAEVPSKIIEIGTLCEDVGHGEDGTTRTHWGGFPPHKGGALSMLILLPKAKTGLDCLEARLPLLNITDMLTNLKERDVEVTIPKFKIELKLELKDALFKMGVQEIFGHRANLSGVADGPLYVKKILQKSFIEVSENGTEAAAATEMEVVWRSGPYYLPFKASHPFLFLIYDEHVRTILFIGRVVEPVYDADS